MTRGLGKDTARTGHAGAQGALRECASLPPPLPLSSFLGPSEKAENPVREEIRKARDTELAPQADSPGSQEQGPLRGLPLVPCVL